MDLRSAEVELGLLLRDARAHVLDHRGVLALQPLELAHLLIQVAAPDVDHAAAFLPQAGNARRHNSAKNLLALAHDAFAQRPLQVWQAAGREQLGIVGDLGHQPLLG